MVKNSKPKGNDAFAFGIEEDGQNHVAVLPICWENLKPVFELLSIPMDEEHHLGIKMIESQEDGRSFLLLHNPMFEQPYPVVIISKYVIDSEGNMLLVDVEQRDMDIVPYVRKKFLTENEIPVIPLKLNNNWHGANAEILTEMGYAYEKGTIFEQNYDAALQLYKIAGRAGDAQAISNIGWMFQNGLGMEKNVPAAIKLYQVAAQDGCTTAMVNLGNIYELGELGEPDYKECFRWSKRHKIQNKK